MVFFKSFSVSVSALIQASGNRGILVYNICLITISNSDFDGVTNKSVILEGHSAINSASEYEPDVLNTFCATRV